MTVVPILKLFHNVTLLGARQVLIFYRVNLNGTHKILIPVDGNMWTSAFPYYMHDPLML